MSQQWQSNSGANAGPQSWEPPGAGAGPAQQWEPSAAPWDAQDSPAPPPPRAQGAHTVAAGSQERLEGLQGEVAALRIRGGSVSSERNIKIGGAGLMVLGIGFIVAGYFKASTPNTSVNNQMAYLFSAGLPGIGLVGIGAALYLRSWIARIRYWQARGVVENREHATQMLHLLARIEIALGGTGELPSNLPAAANTSWETFTPVVPVTPVQHSTGAAAPAAPVASAAPAAADAEARMRTDRDSYAGTGGAPDFFENAAASWNAPEEATYAAHLDANTTYEEEDFADGDEAQPVYTNEHGHVWDHSAQQWFDPGTQQWYDGIAGHWYRRDAAPSH